MKLAIENSDEKKNQVKDGVDRKSEALEAVTFDDLEAVEEIVTGAVSGLAGCCIF